MPDCVFCKIINGEIPTEKVFENEHAFAALDINPCAPGHTVVVPKTHTASIMDLSDDEIANLYKTVNEVAKQIKRALNPDSFNIGLNDGPAAGQGIPHIHVHVIPRYRNDRGGSMHTIVRNPPQEPLESIAGRIRKEKAAELPKKKEKKEEEPKKDFDISAYRKFKRP